MKLTTNMAWLGTAETRDIAPVTTRSKKAFAKSLAKIRIARGMSQADLARKSGYSPSAVSQWENPDSPSFVVAETLDSICDALNTPISSLFAEERDPPDPTEVKTYTIIRKKNHVSLNDALKVVNENMPHLIIKRRSKKSRGATLEDDELIEK